MKFEGKVEDYHMGTLVRLDCNEDISEKNTSLGKDRYKFITYSGKKLQKCFNNFSTFTFDIYVVQLFAHVM